MYYKYLVKYSNIAMIIGFRITCVSTAIINRPIYVFICIILSIKFILTLQCNDDEDKSLTESSTEFDCSALPVVLNAYLIFTYIPAMKSL